MAVGSDSLRWSADAVAIRETLLRHRYNPVASSPLPDPPDFPTVRVGAPRVKPTCSCGWEGTEDADTKAYDQWIGHALREIRGGGAAT